MQRREVRRQLLTQSITFEELEQITDEDSRDEVFPKIKESIGSIWDASNDYELVTSCNENINSNHKVLKRAIDTFGGKVGLQKQNKKRGEVAMMTHSLGFSDNDGNFIRRQEVFATQFFWMVMSKTKQMTGMYFRR